MKTRIERAARGAAAEAHLMAPGAAARRSARAGARSGRVALGRAPIIIGGVKIAAPLVDARAHIVEAEAVRPIESDARRATVDRIDARGIAGVGQRVAPWIFLPVDAAARRALPFR